MQADIDDNFWRFIYLFPLIINTFMVASFMILIKHEPIMYCLSQDREDEAMQLIHKIYHHSEDKAKILDKLKQQVQKKSSVELPFFQSVFGKKYWRSTLVALVTTCYC
jgi:hypothetical protein